MSDLSDLFATDPLKLTAADFVEDWEKRTGHRPLDHIIKVYRDARAQFNLGAKSAGATKKVAKKDLVSIEDIDLTDLMGEDAPK